MKTIKIIAALLMLFAFTANVNAQFLTKEQEKAVKKDVKRYEKEGWKVKPGSPSIAMQLTKSYQMAWEKTAEGTDQWIMGEGSSVGTIYDAARTQAITVAQGEIGRKLRTDLTAQVEQDLANEQLGGGEAESIAQTIVNSMGKSRPEHRPSQFTHRDVSRSAQWQCGSSHAPGHLFCQARRTG